MPDEHLDGSVQDDPAQTDDPIDSTGGTGSDGDSSSSGDGTPGAAELSDEQKAAIVDEIIRRDTGGRVDSYSTYAKRVADLHAYATRIAQENAELKRLAEQKGKQDAGNQPSASKGDSGADDDDDVKALIDEAFGAELSPQMAKLKTALLKLGSKKPPTIDLDSALTPLQQELESLKQQISESKVATQVDIWNANHAKDLFTDGRADWNRTDLDKALTPLGKETLSIYQALGDADMPPVSRLNFALQQARKIVKPAAVNRTLNVPGTARHQPGVAVPAAPRAEMDKRLMEWLQGPDVENMPADLAEYANKVYGQHS